MFFYNDQSIRSLPAASSAAFARLNGLDPKKPRCADKGLGCGAVIKLSEEKYLLHS
jgi:hypothetical protein